MEIGICVSEPGDAADEPEFVRAKYFFRDEFLVRDAFMFAM